MKKILFSMAVLMTTALCANAHGVDSTRRKIVCGSELRNSMFEPLKPTYLNGVAESLWLDNWFISVSGGTSSFLGSPLGCEDLFGRMKPTLQVSLGKWFTPAIGNRVVFQGFEWKSGQLTDQTYHHFHADLLWNLTPTFGIGKTDCRWDIIPLVGIGVIDNRTTRNEHFAFNYGVQVRYRIKDFLHVNAELGNTTTCKNADGIGKPRRFGDHLLSLSAGLTWTFGKRVGWKKIVDARPYMIENEYLAAYAKAQNKETVRLIQQNDANAQMIAELRKILAIEGLLDKYAAQLDTEAAQYNKEKAAYPVNDYSGLNSLRKRLREARNRKQFAGNNSKNNTGLHGDSTSLLSDNTALLADASATDTDTLTYDATEYLARIQSGNECLGAPIYFFFELGTNNLVDASQLVNLNEIARVAHKYSLRIEVTGAADNATGNEEINASLGSSRARFIADYLVRKGVSPENISTASQGGIATYLPNEANRNAIVRLYLP